MHFENPDGNEIQLCHGFHSRAASVAIFGSEVPKIALEKRTLT
jgi:hypothetical protein